MRPTAIKTPLHVEPINISEVLNVNPIRPQTERKRSKLTKKQETNRWSDWRVGERERKGERKKWSYSLHSNENLFLKYFSVQTSGKFTAHNDRQIIYFGKQEVNEEAKL